MPASASALMAAAMSSGVEPVARAPRPCRAGRAGLLGGGVGELLEVGEGVVAEVVVGVLVDLPAHAGVLQRLGVGLPGQARTRRRRRRPGRPRCRRVDHAGPQVGAVGAGRAEDRAVVGVADRVGVGQRVVERDVGAVEVAHACGWSPWRRSSCPSCRCSRPRAGWTSRGPASRRTGRASPAVAAQDQASVSLSCHGYWRPAAVGLVEDAVAAGEADGGRGRRSRARPCSVPK